MPEANYEQEIYWRIACLETANAKLLAQVAECRKTEGALREKERRFQALFNSPTRLIVLLQLDGTLLEANHTALKFGEMTAKEVVGKPFWQAGWWSTRHLELESKKLQEAIARAVSGETVRSQVDVLGAGGSIATLDFSIVPVRDEAGQVVLLTFEGCDLTAQKEVLAVSRITKHKRIEPERLQQEKSLDLKGTCTTKLAQMQQRLEQEIAERHQIEQTLVREKEQAQVTLKSIGDGVITTDVLGRVNYLNPVAERLTGWTALEANGRLATEVFRIVNENTRKPVENPAEKALRSGCTVELADDTVLLARDGTERPISDSATPICDRNGQVLGTVLVFRDISQTRQLAQQLSWQARHDPLTGLANRREFEHRVLEALDDAKHENLQHIVCYLDLDQFKVVNDTCGYVAGDELLRQLASLLKQRVRSTDILVRLGGDEFGILLYRCPLPQAVQLADSLRQLIKDFRFVWEDKTFTIGASIGLVEINPDVDLTNVLGAADAACYAAKNKGRNRVHIYQADDRELAQHLGERQWVAKINQALETDRFCLYCQTIAPVTNHARSAAVEHYEILLRLKDESGKLVPPMAFIPAAERYGLMPAIDRWVIRTFFANYNCQLNLSGLPQCDYTYTINLSGASINDDRFLNYVKEQFALHPIAPQKICFEVTETVAIANLNKAVHFIRELKRLGCQFALDDFGSGMSSFAYLKNLPVDYLKIDGNFVKNIADDHIDQAMVDCINRVGHAIGVQTIAEFVENHKILIKLRELGVDYAQGYGIAKPRPLYFNQLAMDT